MRLWWLAHQHKESPSLSFDKKRRSSVLVTESSESGTFARLLCSDFFEYTHTTQESQHASHVLRNNGEDDAYENDGEVEVRLHGSCASPFLSILTRHRSPNMHHMMAKMMLLETMKMLQFLPNQVIFRYVCMVLVHRLF
jgi:hypothetical protein